MAWTEDNHLVTTVLNAVVLPDFPQQARKHQDEFTK